MTILWVTLTFSAGLPILYLIAFLGFVMMYWADKYLVLHYFRKTNVTTPQLSKVVVDSMKWAVLMHCLFGLAIYSGGYFLATDPQLLYIGHNSQYLNK